MLVLTHINLPMQVQQHNFCYIYNHAKCFKNLQVDSLWMKQTVMENFDSNLLRRELGTGNLMTSIPIFFMPKEQFVRHTDYTLVLVQVAMLCRSTMSI